MSRAAFSAVPLLSISGAKLLLRQSSCHINCDTADFKRFVVKLKPIELSIKLKDIYSSLRFIPLECASMTRRNCRRCTASVGPSGGRLRSLKRYAAAASRSNRLAGSTPYLSRNFARGSGNSNGMAYTDCERPGCRSIRVTKTKAPGSAQSSSDARTGTVLSPAVASEVTDAHETLGISPKSLCGGNLGLLRMGWNSRVIDNRFFSMGVLYGPPRGLRDRLADSDGCPDQVVARAERAGTVAALMSPMMLGQAPPPTSGSSC